MTNRLRGRLERADRLGVVGWAREDVRAAVLDVLVDGRSVATLSADRYRADLASAGEGDGGCAFEAWFEPLADDADREIRVCARDGADLPGSPVSLPAARAERSGERLPDTGPPLALVVDEAAPDAARDAGSVALLSHMAALCRLGYSPVFSTMAEAAGTVTRTAGRIRLAYLHRLRPMALLARCLRAANPGVRVIYSVADLAHLRAEREAAVLGGTAPPGLRAAELAAARAADAVVTHSAVEAALLERALPGARVHAVPWALSPRPVEVALARRAGIAFLGSYGHPPNLDAARVLLDEVMPLVWRAAPIPLLLAGSGMPASLLRRAGGLVEVVRDLPDTVALWRRVRVSAAPLRFGAGIKGKVLDSLAAGIPCVCSPVAAEGLDLPEALHAANFPAMAASLLRLHADAISNYDAATAGLAMVAARHSEAAVDQALARALAPG